MKKLHKLLDLEFGWMNQYRKYYKCNMYGLLTMPASFFAAMKIMDVLVCQGQLAQLTKSKEMLGRFLPGRKVRALKQLDS